jgi:serine/threonine-protein kinase RsbW
MEFTDRPLEPFGRKLLDIAIPTQLSFKMPLVFRMVKELKTAGQLPWTGSHRAELCFDEAITNAMMHGNKLDPARKVRVQLFADDERWGAIVEDEGAGFRPEDLPKADSPDFLLRESGRGIMLMDSYLEKLSYNRKGNALLMTRKRQAEPEAAEMEAAVETEPQPEAAPVAESSGPVAVTIEGEVAVLAILAQRVNEDNVDEIRKAAADTTQTRLLVDLSRVEYVSSRGVSALVSMRKAMDQRKGRLLMTGVQPGVRDILKSLGLLMLFKTAPDRAGALAELQRP